MTNDDWGSRTERDAAAWHRAHAEPRHPHEGVSGDEWDPSEEREA